MLVIILLKIMWIIADWNWRIALAFLFFIPAAAIVNNLTKPKTKVSKRDLVFALLYPLLQFALFVRLKRHPLGDLISSLLSVSESNVVCMPVLCAVFQTKLKNLFETPWTIIY